MKVLRIDGKKDLPSIEFDPETGMLNVSGKSYPSDVRVFYVPLIEWLENYAKAPAPQTELHFRYEYFNTASSKIILSLVDALIPLHEAGSLNVFWHYPSDDPDLLEFGQVMADICRIRIQYVEDEVVD